MGNSILTYNPELNRAIEIARSEARENQHNNWGPPHLLFALLRNEIGLSIELSNEGIDTEYIKDWAQIRITNYPKTGKISPEPEPDAAVEKVLEVADMIRLKLGRDQITTLDVFIAISRPGVGFNKDHLKSYPINEETLLQIFSAKPSSNGYGSNQSNYFVRDEKGSINFGKHTNVLSGKQFGDERITGREPEIRQIYEALKRNHRPNALLIGDPGVGKSSVIGGFVNFARTNSLPMSDGREFVEIDLVSLAAGAVYKGEVEERFVKALNEIKREKAILILEDINQLFDDKSGQFGIINVLKSELNKNSLNLIASATADSLKASLEKDPSFLSHFEIIRITEPDAVLALEMVSRAAAELSDFHKVDLTRDEMSETIRLSRRYLTERKLPASAIGLLDHTLATLATSVDFLRGRWENIQSGQATLGENELGPILKNRLVIDLQSSLDKIDKDAKIKWIGAWLDEERKRLKTDDIHVVLSRKTGIPMGKMDSREKEKILGIENQLRKRVVGQDAALEHIAKAIQEARSGLNEPGKPIASVFFLGPTGTGKTELAKALAEFLFDHEKALIRFDMSEFKEAHAAALLYGAPPGYVGYEEGGLLVNKIRQQPYAVVLFDEIEKAHSSVFDIFLQIMDDGRLSDKLGKEGDFSNAVILFSSNIGSDFITENFHASGSLPASEEMKSIMEKYFRKEFLGRISSIVPFAPIQKEVIPLILDIQLNKIKELASTQGINLEFSEEAKQFLADQGFNLVYGARPLKETVRSFIRQPLSRLLLESKAIKGNKVKVMVNECNLDFKIS